MNLSVLEAIKSRSSIRNYKDTKLTAEEINTLVESALCSPSSRNVQPWSFAFVKNQELILDIEKDVVKNLLSTGDKLIEESLKARDNKIFYNAPLVVFISIKEGGFTKLDAGIAVQNLALTAKSVGMDSVILGLPSAAFQGEKAKLWEEKLKFPEGHSFAIAIAIGHADDKKDPHELDNSKVCIID